MLVRTDYKTVFERDGYVVVPDFFPLEVMAEAKAEVRRVLEVVSAGKAKTDSRSGRENGVYVGLSIQSDWFKAFNARPETVEILKELAGPNLEFWSDKVVYKSANVDFGSPWHQDWQYWKGANKYSIWIALDDATPANGCLRFIPGSHKSVVAHGGQDSEGIGFGNRLRQEDVDELKAVDCPAKAGTAVFFHDLTLHASYRNTSGRDRWALIPSYRDVSQDDLSYDFAKAAFLLCGQRTGRVLEKKSR